MFRSPSGFWPLPCRGASSSSGTLLISSKLRCSSPSLTVSGSGSKSLDLASLHHVSHLASCGALALFANLSFSRSMSMLSRSLLCAMLVTCCSLDLLPGMFSLIGGKIVVSLGLSCRSLLMMTVVCGPSVASSATGTSMLEPASECRPRPGPWIVAQSVDLVDATVIHPLSCRGWGGRALESLVQELVHELDKLVGCRHCVAV